MNLKTRPTGRWGNFAGVNRRSAAHTQLLADDRNRSDEWYTPPALIAALGQFDLDPACGPGCPNRTARRRYGSRGLDRPWEGRVWLNPPFSDVKPWIERMIAHGNGAALVFARADAKWFQQAVVAARGVFLLHGRIQFDRPGGTVGKCPLGCVLFGFGAANRRAIQRAGLPGLWLAYDR